MNDNDKFKKIINSAINIVQYKKDCQWQPFLYWTILVFSLILA
jgi:hypothetical protein